MTTRKPARGTREAKGLWRRESGDHSCREGRPLGYGAAVGWEPDGRGGRDRLLGPGRPESGLRFVQVQKEIHTTCSSKRVFTIRY